MRSELNELTPRLRRYARALSGGNATPCDLADDLVHATLMRALGARHIGAPADLVIRLYATVTQLNREVAVSSRQARAAGAGRPTLIATGRSFSAARQSKLSAGLMGLSLEAREALLLVGLEDFDYADAARILRISRSVLLARLTQARTMLGQSLNSGPISAPIAQAAGGSAGLRARAPYLRLVT